MGGEGSGDKPGHEFHGNQYSDEVLSFEEYKGKKNIPEMEHGRLRFPHGISKIQEKRNSEAASKLFREQMEKTAQAQKEYKELVDSGKVRPPTRMEELTNRASGHPDNQSVQAARRLLKKMGYEWKE